MEENKPKVRIHIYIPPPKREVKYTIPEMYDEYWEHLVRVFKCFLKGNPSEAEDLAQEVFLKVLRFISITKEGVDTPRIGSLLSFLAQQTWAQYMRERGEANFRNYDEDPSSIFETEMCTTLYGHTDPFNIAIETEEYEGLLLKISKMKDVDQKIIEEVFINEKSIKKVAKSLKISYLNLLKRIERIRSKLGKYQGE